MTGQLELVSRYGMRTEQFSELMAFRVRQVLLVASRYDAFVLEEDGELAELLSQEYRDLGLNVGYAPRFARAETGDGGLQLLRGEQFDMVVTTARLPDMPLHDFATQVRRDFPTMSIGVLAAHGWDLAHLEGLRESGVVDWVFLSQGGVKTLLAMIQQEEDRRNADHDILQAGVQVIVLVEDDVRFVSFILPHLYAEVTRQTERLMAEGLNLSHRLLRLQARPKIMLAQTLEEAWRLIERYGENVLGLISDIRFPRDGRQDAEAGLELTRRVRARDPEMPVLLLSSESDNRPRAVSLSAVFLDKTSPMVLDDVRRFILDSFGFGDFVFRLPDGAEVGRASEIRELLVELDRVPELSLEYHASHNHFSRWFKARTEFEVASALRPRTVSEFASLAELRAFLVRTVTGYLREIKRHVLVDFAVDRFDEFVGFAKIGSGSLGGKGRGLAFMQQLLAQEGVSFANVETVVPQTVAIATEVFEEFLERNGLQTLVSKPGESSDPEVLDAVRMGRFHRSLRADLAKFLQVVRGPLAVRSSSLLEDSPYQPFAGVYATIMLPNNHPSLDVRLAQLLEAIKVVYASTFMQAARAYLASTPHRLEEERMAVLLQRVVGSSRGARFYPTFSGVACSYNFYPFREMRSEDGVALVAVGLGKSVVDGFEALRFCPAWPQVLPQFSATKDILRNAQRRFWALDMSCMDVIPGLEYDANLISLEVTEALADSGAATLASTYLRPNDTVVDGIVPGGSPLVTFSRVLKGSGFPLAEILTCLLRASQRALGVPVEVEFAVDLKAGETSPVFHVLQVRPMLIEPLERVDSIGAAAADTVIADSANALGHGRRTNIRDVVVVLPTLERAHTPEVASILERQNQRMRGEGRGYLLIGPGRWGSRDPWLGVPVAWAQISAAAAIVETDFSDLEVEPSQGSHFFHNLTSFGIPFLAVHRLQDGGSVNWEWLAAHPAEHEELAGRVRHIRLDRSLEVVVDGATRRGLVVLRG